MTAFYLRIFPMQQPTDLGPDETGMSRIAFNVLATKGPSTSFPREIVQVLVDAGVGTYQTNPATDTLFISTMPVVPTDRATIRVTETGGPAPQYDQNEAGPARLRPTAQIMVKGPDYDAAVALAWSAFTALSQVRNTTVTA